MEMFVEGVLTLTALGDVGSHVPPIQMSGSAGRDIARSKQIANRYLIRAVPIKKKAAISDDFHIRYH